MPLYSNCRVAIKLPPNYPNKEELTKILESEYEGCEINFEEAATQKPYLEEAFVPENSQLSRLQASQWTPPGTPGPMENISAQCLIRSVSETVQKVVEYFKRMSEQVFYQTNVVRAPVGNERGRVTLHYIIAVHTHDPNGHPYGDCKRRAKEALNLTLGRGVGDPVNLTDIKEEVLPKEKLHRVLLRHDGAVFLVKNE